MNYKNLLIYFLTIVIVSCAQNSRLEEVNGLNEIQIFDSENNLVSIFYLNQKKQKDSLEVLFENNQIVKQIVWDSGKITSKQSDINNLTVRDTLLNTGEKIKSTIDEMGFIQGLQIKFKDSTISSISNYKNDILEGFTLHFDSDEYPSLIGDLSSNSFNFGIQFYEDSKSIKSLMVDYKTSRLGIIYDYFPNGSIKSKSQLLDGKTDGIVYKYNLEGDLISKQKYKNGIPLIE
jgi:antitoxin component YwqK of YwqJK toxin-antitoxin module